MTSIDRVLCDLFEDEVTEQLDGIEALLPRAKDAGRDIVPLAGV
jgi:hypothetical protein